MSTLNEEIKKMKYEIAALKSKMANLSMNSESKPPTPYSKLQTSKGQGWWFKEGKWVSYAIYAD